LVILENVPRVGQNTSTTPDDDQSDDSSQFQGIVEIHDLPDLSNRIYNFVDKKTMGEMLTDEERLDFDPNENSLEAEVMEEDLEADTEKPQEGVNAVRATYQASRNKNLEQKFAERVMSMYLKLCDHEELPTSRATIPRDCLGKYRYGIEPGDMAGCSDKLKDLLSFRFAKNSDILNLRIRAAVKKFGNHDLDSGSPAVQVAILSERIRMLSEHRAKFPSDKRCLRGLQRLYNERKSNLKYLKRSDLKKYYEVINHYIIPEPVQEHRFSYNQRNPPKRVVVKRKLSEGFGPRKDK